MNGQARSVNRAPALSTLRYAVNSPILILSIGIFSMSLFGCESRKDEPAPRSKVPATAPPVAKAKLKTQTAKPKAKPSRTSRSKRATSATDIVKRLDGKIAFHTQRGQKRRQWLDLDLAASAHMARAQVTGSLEDLQEAERRIEQSFEYAPERMKPLLTRARHLIANHRFKDAVEVLGKLRARGAHPDGRLAVIAGMRGSIALEMGDHAKALKELQAALAFKRTPSTLALLANYYAKTGDLEKARALLDEAIKIPVPALGLDRAWIRLQRGLIDLTAGRPADALVYYRKAEAQLVGWYLVEEHIAEAAIRRDRTQWSRRKVGVKRARKAHPGQSGRCTPPAWILLPTRAEAHSTPTSSRTDKASRASST